MDQILPILVVPLIVGIFACFWMAVILLIATASGWRKLAQRYARSEPIVGTTWRGQHAQFRGGDGPFGFFPMGYNGCLRFTANEEGLGLSMMLLFRFGHRPLFIPWADIVVSQEKSLRVFKLARLTFTEVPPVSMAIQMKLADKMQQALGQNWFDDEAQGG